MLHLYEFTGATDATVDRQAYPKEFVVVSACGDVAAPDQWKQNGCDCTRGGTSRSSERVLQIVILYCSPQPFLRWLTLR
jgi:hypothetical protein